MSKTCVSVCTKFATFLPVCHKKTHCAKFASFCMNMKMKNMKMLKKIKIKMMKIMKMKMMKKMQVGRVGVGGT